MKLKDRWKVGYAYTHTALVAKSSPKFCDWLGYLPYTKKIARNLDMRKTGKNTNINLAIS